MDNQTYTSKQYFTSLKVIHVSLVLGQVLFAIVTIFLGAGESEPNKDLSFNLVVVPILLVAGISVGHFIADFKLKRITEGASLKNKLDQYRTKHIIRCVATEVPTLFAIINYMLTNNYIFLIYAAIGLVYMVYISPSKSKVLTELKLSKEEKETLSVDEFVVH